jgi:HTH-type transcriptional regulator, competence development regulator
MGSWGDKPMKMNTDPNWLKKKASMEDGGFVSVGGLVSEIGMPGREFPVNADPLRHAFVRLLQLKRREKSLSLEELANKADIDLAELMRIARDEHHTPNILTVCRIAEFFRLPQRPLLALAGLLEPRDDSFQHESLRFAARSEPVEKLSREEHKALEEYVKFLCDK